MQISLLTVVTMILVLLSASAETSSLRGGSLHHEEDGTNTDHRAVEECVDALPVFSVYKGKKCDWITKDETNVAKKCNKSSSLGVVYDLCPFTCAKVGLGPCATSRATSQDTCGKCSGCLKPSGDCNNDDYEQASCKQIGLVWCGTSSDFPSDGPSASPSMDPSFKPSVSPSSQPTSTPSESPSNKSSDSPGSNGDTLDSLRETIAYLEASLTATSESLEENMATIETLEESIAQKDSTIADLSLQIETIGVPNDPTSQCNAEDGELAFDKCQCSELTVIKNAACLKVPIDCVNGFERGTGLTCDRACDGDCCAGDTSVFGNYSPCAGFTGLVHRDGSCTGKSACRNASIDEVKGPSCTGNRACWNAEVGLIEGGCNGSSPCDGEITDSIVDGKILREETCKGEFACSFHALSFATSIVDGTIYYAPQDPQDVCLEDCNAAYSAAGADGVGGVPGSGRRECNDDEFVAYPNWCTYLTCKAECRVEFE